MAQATTIIFPTSVYGQIGDVYGTAVTAYANTQGFPSGAGLILGQYGQLFDGTTVRLLNANAGIAQYNAVKYIIAQSNDYTVVNTATVDADCVAAVNDRAGATALVQNNIAWMTARGIAQCNVAASLTAPARLASSNVAGRLGAFTAGTSLTNDIWSLNTTTTAGAYPVKLF